MERAKTIYTNEPLKPLRRTYCGASNEIDLNNEQTLNELQSLIKFSTCFLSCKRKMFLETASHWLKFHHLKSGQQLKIDEIFYWQTMVKKKEFLFSERCRMFVIYCMCSIYHLYGWNSPDINVLPSLFFACNSPGYHNAAMHLPPAFKTGITYTRMFNLMKNAAAHLRHHRPDDFLCWLRVICH